MQIVKRNAGIAIVTLAFMVSSLVSTPVARAHCDTTTGPVIGEAKAALEKGEVTPILKWVKKEHEAEITAAFARTIAVRSKGPEVKELADRYFLETLVRLHRAGEGEPYTGIKDEPAEAVVAMADRSLAGGSAELLIKQINAHAAAAIEEKFRIVSEARKQKDTSVAAGREYVEAYVAFMHFVEGIHTAVMSGGGHEHGVPERDKAPRDVVPDAHRD